MTLRHAWFTGEGGHGWATCPLTENGFIRVLSQPVYPNSVDSPSSAAAYLQRTIKAHSKTHQFWEDDISLLDDSLFLLSSVVGRDRSLTSISSACVRSAAGPWLRWISAYRRPQCLDRLPISSDSYERERTVSPRLIWWSASEGASRSHHRSLEAAIDLPSVRPRV
jgi:hypothetical protein